MTMKRQFRNYMSQQQKDKIGFANKGRKHTQQTKDKISKSLEKYWSQLPIKPASSGGTTTTPPPSSNPYQGE